MKKLLALIMALCMMLSFTACGDEPEAPVVENPVIESEPEIVDNPTLVSYLEANKTEFIDAMTSSFEQSAGTTCQGDVKVSGDGFVIDIKVSGLNDIPDDAKAQLQSAYDATSETFEGILTQMQAELPELKYVTYNVCEEDGDILAVINSGEAK